MKLPLIIILYVVSAVSASSSESESESEEEPTTYASTSSSVESDEDYEDYPANSVIDKKLLDKLASEDSVADVIITMKDTTTDVHKKFRKQKFQSRNSKLKQLRGDLKAHCSRSQNKLVNVLKLAGHNYEAYWLTNQVIIKKADMAVLRKLEKMDENNIDKMEEVKEFKLDDGVEEVFNGDDAMIEAVSSSAQWGVTKIRGPEVWSTGITGNGIVVGGVDTGVRYTHEALSNSYVGKDSDYGWYDPSGKTCSPSDTNGHGTHTMGTILGTTNGIGVAPGARWMACKGCATSSCSQSDLLSCGQYMICPTKCDGTASDCSKSPRIVSNSWVSSQSGTWYDGILEGYRSAGIVSVFANGNFGPNCTQARYPGCSNKTIGVGSTDSSDKMSSFSSPGPTVDGNMSPVLAAPGTSVYSAYNTADNAYATLSGTSMACPHVAGVVALLLQSISNLTIAQVITCLTKGSVKTTSTGAACGGVPDTTWPNNQVGAGRLDAVNAIAVSKTLNTTM